ARVAAERIAEAEGRRDRLDRDVKALEAEASRLKGEVRHLEELNAALSEQARQRQAAETDYLLALDQMKAQALEEAKREAREVVADAERRRVEALSEHERLGPLVLTLREQREAAVAAHAQAIEARDAAVRAAGTEQAALA